eukprot:XP_015572994.1 uncharacterized protein LOC107261023 [Ricinus communis]
MAEEIEGVMRTVETRAEEEKKGEKSDLGASARQTLEMTQNMKKWFGATWEANRTGRVCGLGRIIDSGATDHMTWDPTKLHTFVPIESQHVIVANGGQAPISGSGTSTLLNKTIHDILLLPDFKSNLLSVGKITRYLNCNVIFSPSSVMFQDRITGKMIGEGYCKNGLYYLQDPIRQCLASMNPVDQGMLMHRRLGHPSDPVLDKLFPSKLKF